MTKKRRPDIQLVPQLYQDESYDSLADTEIESCYNSIERLKQRLEKYGLDGVSITPNGSLYLLQTGGWEVSLPGKGQHLISPSEELETILGYFCAESTDTEPHTAYFRLSPNIKKADTARKFFAFLLRAHETLESQYETDTR